MPKNKKLVKLSNGAVAQILPSGRYQIIKGASKKYMEDIRKKPRTGETKDELIEKIIEKAKKQGENTRGMKSKLKMMKKKDLKKMANQKGGTIFKALWEGAKWLGDKIIS